jgi:hypothetical protein
MGRIRTIKPELRTDLTVGSWPIPARYAWVLLLGYVDDAGRGLDDLRLLVADLFPLDRDVTERRLNAWLDLMAEETTVNHPAPLCRYEIDGKRYLHATRWANHQKISRPTRSRIPPCPIHEKPGRSTEGSANDSRSAQ